MTQPNPTATATPQAASPAIAWASVPLPPDLPMATFTSTEIWQPERIGALVLYCSDGRWNEAFDEFCHHSLMIPRYDRFALPGGPAFLTRAPTDPLLLALRPQLDYLVEHHELDRIVLITHYACGHYQQQLKAEPAACLPTQLTETVRAAELLRQWYPKHELTVEAYLAMRTDRRLSFHRLDPVAKAAAPIAAEKPASPPPAPRPVQTIPLKPKAPPVATPPKIKSPYPTTPLDWLNRLNKPRK